MTNDTAESAAESLRTIVGYIDKLRHMLGASEPTKSKDYGYRNRYCADVQGDDYTTMMQMARLGLVSLGRAINEGRDVYFHATEEGCRLAGLDAEAIKRAME